MKCSNCDGRGWFWSEEYNEHRRCMDPVRARCGECNETGEVDEE
jgi:hypothetical protein